jgi:sigma-B regulation protein RsbU (phosphoserine phosphatase)
MFVTVFYGILDTRSGAFEYSNGGHNPPYLISLDESVKQIENIGGLMVGAMKDVPYESNVIMLKPGESIVFYTDGVTEAFNKEEEEFQESRLAQIIDKKSSLNVNEMVEHIFANVQSFTDGVEQSDDITCLALKYLRK